MVMSLFNDLGKFAKGMAVRIFLGAIATIRSIVMGSGISQRLKNVELHRHPYPNYDNFQDIVITSKVGGIDVTTEYNHRLGFKDPRTLLYDVSMDTVWKTLCRATEGTDRNEMGRVEVTFVDSFCKEKKIVFTPANEKVVLPLHKKITPVLSPGVRAVTLEIDRKDFYPEDNFDDEATVLSDYEEEQGACRGSFDATGFFAKWVPNKKSAANEIDQTMFWLALRDTILGDDSVRELFEPPLDLDKSVFNVQINMIFSDQSIYRTSLNFVWTPFVFKSKLL